MSGYAAASALEQQDDGRNLLLETALGLTPAGTVENPSFFSGFVARPQVVAAGLLAIADVAATTYFNLSALVQASLDPVVTASGDRLRFESFSRCNGVYARFDLLADGIDSGDVRFGTTNVDVNAPLRTHLAAIAPAELLHMSVGHDDLRVSTPGQTHVERRVDLPDRWVRGFAEVPGIGSGMELAAELSRADSMRFLAGLPRSAPGPSLHLAPTPRGLAASATADRCQVHLAGTARLTSARRIMRFITRMRVFRHSTGASGWVFDLEGARVSLLLTAEPYRGFSGEGGLLHDLGTARPADQAVLLEHLAWQPAIDPSALARDAGIGVSRVRSGLAVLATSGRVGFDLAESAWFHRELPLSDERLTRDNPRLVKARELVAAGLVTPAGGQWRIGDGESAHWVRRENQRLVCSCPWEARYGGGRGPCSHVLAVDIATDR